MSRFTVDIDIGGTLTDGLFSDGQQVVAVKVDTTPHDFTVCFLECLGAGAERLGFPDLAAFLARVAAIRWSSTIATNVVAERKGPRVGLLVSSGQAETVYGQGRSPLFGVLLDPGNVAEIAQPVNSEQVLSAVRRLLARGVRRVCVSFAAGFAEAEQAVKKIIQEQYPDHYLGSVPVLLGTEILRHPDDQTRTHLAVINAYVHTPLAVALFKAEDDLMKHQYRRPVYVGHVNGGVARIAKTRGIDTVESGPVFGLFASAYFARQYGLSRVLSLDVGGTTTKLGVIRDGQPVTIDRGDLFGIPLQTPWLLLRSDALGGGSIARVRDGQVTLGPDSMGAYPGPACYDLGGNRTTLTDALVAAGTLNPGRFLGGRRQLSVEQARGAIARDVAEPLRLEVEAAARYIIAMAADALAVSARATLTPLGEAVAPGYRLFAFGGNGAIMAAALAAQLGLDRVYIFGLGPVFSAFGSSVSHVRHVHEEWPYIGLDAVGATERVAQAVAHGRQRVHHDLDGEGLAAPADFSASLYLRGPDAGHVTVMVPLQSDATAPAAVATLPSRYPGHVVERVQVQGVCPVPYHEPERQPAAPHRPMASSRRRMDWLDGVHTADVFDWDRLQRGAAVAGPAVLEGETYTCVVPAGWRLEIDEFGNGILAPGGR